MSKTFFNMPNNIIDGHSELTSKVPVAISFQNSSSLPWATDRPEALREGGDSPPPAKRARSSERDSFPDRERSPARNNNGEMSESLLGQALEGGPNISLKEVKHTKFVWTQYSFVNYRFQKSNTLESPNHPQSTCEDSNSSDTALSEHGDGEHVTPKTEPSEYPNMMDEHNPFHTNGGLMDQSRPPSFPGALLGLQGEELIFLMYFVWALNVYERWERFCFITYQEYLTLRNMKFHVCHFSKYTSGATSFTIVVFGFLM